MKISVVMCVKNNAATIGEAIESFDCQDYPDKELIVVDGASTDGTLHILRAASSLIAHFISEPDEGPAHAIQKGVALATGNIICFLMADDWLEPGGLRLVMDAFKNEPACDVISAGARIVQWEGGRRSVVIERGGSQTRISFSTILDIPFGAAHYWRAESYRALGGFSRQFPFANDRDLFARAVLSGYRIGAIEPIVYNFRMHEHSRTMGEDLNRRRAFLMEHIEMAGQWQKMTPAVRPHAAAVRAWASRQHFEIVLIDIHQKKYAQVIGTLLRNLDDPGLLRSVAALVFRRALGRRSPG
jgi:glycosyltransferase involved in cell wall biosynthesis